MTHKKLKPCPFCGCAARLYFDIAYENGKGKWFTVVGKCWSCDAQGQGVWSAPYEEIECAESVKRMGDGATWRWNRRSGESNE